VERKRKENNKYKNLKNHYNHYNINGHTKDKHWKLHPKLNPKNYKNNVEKKNMVSMDSENQVKRNSCR
jgi:hypothetical protein